MMSCVNFFYLKMNLFLPCWNCEDNENIKTSHLLWHTLLRPISHEVIMRNMWNVFKGKRLRLKMAGRVKVKMSEIYLDTHISIVTHY